MKDQKDMENNMKSLVELYPDLFEVKPNSFFEKDELEISDEIDLSTGRIKDFARRYAEECIDDAATHLDAVEECEERVFDGVRWYYTNFPKLNVLSDRKFASVLKSAMLIYARDYCKNVLYPTASTKKEARLFKNIIIDDFSMGIKYAELEMMSHIFVKIGGTKGLEEIKNSSN